MSTGRCIDNDNAVRPDVVTRARVPALAGGGHGDERAAPLRLRHDPYAIPDYEVVSLSVTEATGMTTTGLGPGSLDLAFGQIPFVATEAEVIALVRNACQVEPIAVRPHVFHRSRGRPAKSKGLWFVTVAAADAPLCLVLNHRLLFGEHCMVYKFNSTTAAQRVMCKRDSLFPCSKAPRLVDIAMTRTPPPSNASVASEPPADGDSAAVAAPSCL